MARECAPSEKATPRGARRRGGASGKIPAATYSPTRKPCSTIGSGGLNCRVRDGNGWNPSDKATGNSLHMRKRRVVAAAPCAALDPGLIDFGKEAGREERPSRTSD